MEIGKLNQRVRIEQRSNFRTPYGGLDDTWYPALNGVSDIAESGTTTTNIKVTAHGLVTGDYVVNVTRSTVRVVTKVDSDNFTVSTTSSQTTGDVLALQRCLVSTVWGKVSGRSVYVNENSMRKVETIHEVYLRYRADITKNHSLRIDNRRFEILGITNVDESNNYLRLTCRELV
jgi:SPP1 family predicted phage head-tail adaptor